VPGDDYGAHLLAAVQGARTRRHTRVNRLLFRYLRSHALGTDREVESEVPLAVATAISGEPDTPAVQRVADLVVSDLGARLSEQVASASLSSGG